MKGWWRVHLVAFTDAECAALKRVVAKAVAKAAEGRAETGAAAIEPTGVGMGVGAEGCVTRSGEEGASPLDEMM